MVSVSDVYSFNNTVYNTYVFYCAVLGMKMLIMSLLTGRLRHSKKTFANPEDAKSGGKVRVDEDVERVRRAHLNDLENIPVFIFVCGLYLLTGPTASLAINLIRIFTLARIAHTLVYAVVVVPQPARGIAWGVGFFITLFMAVKTMLYFIQYM